MELGIGMDIVELERIANAKYFFRLAEFILTQNELEIFTARYDKQQFLASRFAAKEAVIKALPVAATFQDLEILKDGLKPVCYPIKPELKHYKISITMTHSTIFAGACAVVLLE